MSHRHDIERRAMELAATLAGSDLSFVTAESCTGGQLSALLAGNAELGPHLERGFTAYSVDAKCELQASIAAMPSAAMPSIPRSPKRWHGAHLRTAMPT